MGLYLIESGKCIIVNNGMETKIFSEIGRGDMFGDSFVLKQPVSKCKS